MDELRRADAANDIEGRGLRHGAFEVVFYSKIVARHGLAQRLETFSSVVSFWLKSIRAVVAIEVNATHIRVVDVWDEQ